MLEENNLKEKLQNEVTKVKEKLENFLTESNKLIRTNDKINKGLKVIENENEKEKNLIRNLSYITKINKNKKEMNSLFMELMKNINIFFIEKENNIKFEEYYFNGLQVPYNIEFKDILSNSLKISWIIDNINIKDINNKEIKFRVEIREQKENKNFFQVYEGSEKNCFIENLKEASNYEIRICCIYNNLVGNWSKIIMKSEFVAFIII